MSAKYNQHPLEAKAASDIKAAQSERETVALSYSAWLEFWQKSSDGMPTAFQCFRAGWTEAMEFVRITQAPTPKQNEGAGDSLTTYKD